MLISCINNTNIRSILFAHSINKDSKIIFWCFIFKSYNSLIFSWKGILRGTKRPNRYESTSTLNEAISRTTSLCYFVRHRFKIFVDFYFAEHIIVNFFGFGITIFTALHFRPAPLSKILNCEIF